MPGAPLLVFDFDGVLVDGMPEYWWSARRAALRLDPSLELPEEVPPPFRRLRPLIHKGWEMVLIAAELADPAAPLPADLPGYASFLAAALERRGWSPDDLQRRLEQVRAEAIATDAESWLGLHRFFPGVVTRLEGLASEGADWAVLTTKGRSFAERLLAAAGLVPWGLFGHEQGSKPEVLRRLAGEPPEAGGAGDRPLWFVEDRRPTLERVRSSPDLGAVRCFLVSWGYLAPGDERDLAAQGIAWLEPARFAGPLAHWPEPATVRPY